MLKIRDSRKGFEMKYGKIVFDGNRKTSVNIGDDTQIVAIEYLYSKMGIKDSEIVNIGLSELSTYDGEYAILPISFPLYGYRSGLNITMFSPKIIPVFLGLSIMSENISEEEIAYLRRYEPIGCRDYYTLDILRRKNIMSYMGGCVTALLPRLDKINGEQIYMIDVPKSFYKYIPEDIIKKAKKISQILDNSNSPIDDAKNRLRELAEKARLVITTRLHSALPSTAMGIPVVLMKKHFSFRFTTLSNYLCVYTQEEFNNIDWNPEAIEYEKEKQRIVNYDIKRIKETFEKYSEMLSVSEFYENAPKPLKVYVEHFDNVIEDVKDKLDSGEIKKYAIWGITQKSDMICSYMEKNYPDIKLEKVYDRSRNIVFHGVQSVNKESEICCEDVFVFVTAATANKYAKELFDRIGKKNYHISTDGIGE